MPGLVKKWQFVADLLQGRDVVAMVTSSEWANLARELKEDYGSSITPTNINFTQVIISNLTIRNAETEDQDVVNLVNNELLGDEGRRLLEWRKSNWAVGYKKDETPY